jgi:hypothetical protein
MARKNMPKPTSPSVGSTGKKDVKSKTKKKLAVMKLTVVYENSEYFFIETRDKVQVLKTKLDPQMILQLIGKTIEKGVEQFCDKHPLKK